MAGQNCNCAVDLFCHHQPRQRVGHRHRPEREQELRLFTGCVRPAAGRTHRENDVLAPLVAACAQPPGECLRGHLPPATVQQHRNGWRSTLLPPQPFKHGLLSAECLRPAARKRRATFEIGFNQRVERVLRTGPGPDMRQRNLHGEEDNSTATARAAGSKQETLSIHIWNIKEIIYSFPYLRVFGPASVSYTHLTL